jgi:O-antigen/teichoic acid export membrane protein
MARSEAFGEARPADLLRLVWLGLPLGGVLMLGALNSNMPRYFIEAHLGTEILGIFAAMAYFTVAGNLIIQAVGQAAVVRLATLHASGDRSGFARLLGKMMLFALGLGVLGVLIAWGVGALILELAYGARFAQQPALFVMVMAVALVSYLAAPLGYAMTAMQRFRVQFFLFLTVVLISATGCWLLTPRYGMHGALLGWLGGLLAQLALAAGVTFEALRQPTGQPRMP